MTAAGAEQSPWDRFQTRIKLAICRAADEHETVGDLLSDLLACEELLRSAAASIDDVESPAARELRSALATHAAEDPVLYDEVCAANVVLAAMNAIANMLPEGER